MTRPQVRRLSTELAALYSLEVRLRTGAEGQDRFFALLELGKSFDTEADARAFGERLILAMRPVIAQLQRETVRELKALVDPTPEAPGEAPGNGKGA